MMCKIETTDNTLFVGAGKEKICLPEQIFPTWEGYTGVHDDPCVEVFLIENQNKFCLVNFEMISLNDEIENYKRKISSITGTPLQNCWICVSHVLPSPHIWVAGHCKTKEDAEKNEIMLHVLEQSMLKAAQKAIQSKTEALFGFGLGRCDINVNRNIMTEKGWWLGSNDENPVDKSVSVFRFDRMDGSPIAILFNYNAQSSVLDNVYTSNKERLVSGDLAGFSARFVEKEFGEDTVAAYLLGAGGDSGPAFKGVQTIVGKDGKTKDINCADHAYQLAELLGQRLAQEVIRTAETIQCKQIEHPIGIHHYTVTLNGQIIPPTETILPARQYEYIPADDVVMPVELFIIQDAVLIGIKPEICSRTLEYIKKKSPLPHVSLMTFVNGGAKYMPEKEMYDMVTYQSMNSQFARGSAEIFRHKIIQFLYEAADIYDWRECDEVE